MTPPSTDHDDVVHEQHGFVVIANRLPVERHDGEWRTSPGGLVRALLGVLRDQDGAWLGWTGVADEPPMSFRAEGVDLISVPLSDDEIHRYYENVSNEAIWPLYHDAIRNSSYDAESWTAYQAVNRRFAEHAARVSAPDAVVWIHDYQLQLVPAMLRALRPDLRIGFFLHIPFPPQELFMRLPWREEILHGLLGADLIGFQRRVAAENFDSLARRLVDAQPAEGGGVYAADGRVVQFGAFPISIDVGEIDSFATSPSTIEAATQLRSSLGDPTVVLLGVDRLDYTKGIEERLNAFRSLLAAHEAEHGPTSRPAIVLVQIAVPSRGNVDDYLDQRQRVEQMIGTINGEYATLGYPAVHYLHQTLPLEELVSLYVAADVMLVTPLRDGMNLVAKEFVAARADGKGVLVLSEFAGAADELTEAVLVNPHDPEALVAAIEEGIVMPAAEVHRRMAAMRDVVATHDVARWAESFLEALSATTTTQRAR